MLDIYRLVGQAKYLAHKTEPIYAKGGFQNGDHVSLDCQFVDSRAVELTTSEDCYSVWQTKASRRISQYRHNGDELCDGEYIFARPWDRQISSPYNKIHIDAFTALGSTDCCQAFIDLCNLYSPS